MTKKWPKFQHCSRNILDLVLTSEEDHIGQIQTLPPMPGSDHCPVLMEYIFSAHIPLLAQGPERHAWNREKYSRIHPIPSGIDWRAEFEGLNTDNCFELLTTRVKLLTGLHPHLLKECANAIATPLHLILCKSLEEGIVPTLWKTSRVTQFLRRAPTATMTH